MNDAIADPAGELARITQQPRDASEPVRRAREDPPRQTRGEKVGEVGELDAHFRLKDEIDKLGVNSVHAVIDCPPALGLLTVNVLGGGDAPPDSDSVVLLRARRNGRLLEAIESGSLRIPASASCGRGEGHHGRESCRGARHEGCKTLPSISPQANSSISFLDQGTIAVHRIDLMHLACTTRSPI